MRDAGRDFEMYDGRYEAAIVKDRKKPTEGRYSRCSKIPSRIGMIEDSMERVRKNQRIPKARSCEI
jgi:hypothetical protein